MRHPQLREEPRHQKAAVLPSTQRESILEWLRRSGKLQSRNVVDEEALAEDEDFDDLVDDDEQLYDDDDTAADDEE
ncbi:MAG: DUF3134 domain-containing protein [Aphanocapsa lilacina HA4352-LM1]|jgi:hypothetical protein|uniref:DUF3134 domain-containing protein n=1 Tax=Gloeobacter morelensis MG652769 TaxID=2781736 RepID=A0ABY3PKE3_9CYAN|nr:DUF3134 family protein [Gloeobacter morelensis]MBW4697264.1 DUF3134 domain-containing protein [Aphanocapsa lilacina HA4352-LM1]UFP94094.1 DUF3134 domain-containing protein [Gloeobacter morelensis MG652769]